MTLAKKWILYYCAILLLIGAAYFLASERSPIHLPVAVYVGILLALFLAAVGARIFISKHSEPPGKVDARSEQEVLRAIAQDIHERRKPAGR